MNFLFTLWRYKGVVAVVAAVAATSVFIVMTYDRGYNDGYNDATRKAQEFTERAINELGGEADDAAADFLDCVNGGGLWDFSANECAEG